MRLLFAKVICLFILLFAVSCEKKIQLPSNKVQVEDPTSAEMIKLNKLLAEVEQQEMKDFVSKAESSFKESPLGFWYTITEKGSGKQIKKSDVVLVDYQVETLAGQVCYVYSADKQQKLVVGKAQRERGFNEGLELLHEGDKAIFVVPSNLCFGMLGDADKIPPRTVLIYRVNNINIK